MSGTGPWDREAMRTEVVAGLQAHPRQLSPKYFYDQRGSELFEEITHLPEYYPTEKEWEILQEAVPAWIDELRPATLVELGAGSARKTRTLLDAMSARRREGFFVPVDVSASFVRDTARAVDGEYPGLSVVPEVADISGDFRLRSSRPPPVLYALLGGTLGNFGPPTDVTLLSRIRRLLLPGDAFLVGVDLRPGNGKAREVVEAAYNDGQGVTAEFNRNVLHVLNRELGADFDPEAFEHRAHYDSEGGRIEMRLVARREQRVTIPGAEPLAFQEGEWIRTELSCKFTRDLLAERFQAAGLGLARWATDRDGYFAMALGSPGR